MVKSAHHEEAVPPGGGAAQRIAIVGAGCRFPGGVHSVDTFWKLLAGGRSAIREVPPERWDVSAFYDPEPGVPGRTVSRWGGFLDRVDGFDTEFFGVSADEAEGMDPQHRLLIELSWEALEHAGIVPGSLAGSHTGVFAGLSYHDHLINSHEAGVLHRPYSMLGNAHCVAAGRIAYLLGVHGPAMALDTACSSALVAVHQACQSLRAGECDLALAGGVTLMFRPETAVAFSGWGMLSPRGRCSAFCAEADGFVRSEGAAVVALKRMKDALADGDRVLAVVRGSAVNQDGRSRGLAAPSAPAQEDVQRRALAAAGVDAAQVGLLEAHGAGTPVGDPVEFAALNAVYGTGRGRCALGSVKTNIGHTESASGVAGLLKTVLSLRHGVVPGNVGFTGWSPEIDASGSRLFVPTGPVPWPVDDGPRLAAVSSFGFSGTNVHMVLERAEAEAPHALPAPGDSGRDLLFPVSAGSPEALAGTAARIADWLEGDGAGAALADVGHTLALRRGHRRHRAAVVASTRDGLVAGLRAVAADRAADGLIRDVDRLVRGGPVWVFSGQGSQWAGMGRGPLAQEPAFAAAMDELEPLVAAESGFSLREVLTGPDVVTGIDRVQPALFAMQVSLAAAWRARGVEPAAVIGHSMGEAAAAVVAGALTPADGVKVICRRSALMATLAGAGAMASVELPADQVEAELRAAGVSDVVVGVVSSPRSTVVSGTTERVHALVAGWEARDLMARQVSVDVASHSAQVDPILEDVAARLACLRPRTPRIPFYSTVSDGDRARPVFDAAYWVANLRQPVRFADAVQAALADGHRVFTEISPHPLLTHAVTETADHAGRPAVARGTLRRDDGPSKGLLSAVADAHCAGIPVDWSTHHPGGRLADVPLPLWADRRLPLPTAGKDTRRAAGDHPLLGTSVRLPDQQGSLLWQGDVGTGPSPWLADHRVHGVPVLPGAAYCEMALAAGARLFGTAVGVEVHDLSFQSMLALDEHTTTVATATPEVERRARFEIRAEADDEGWTVHSSATLIHVGDGVPPDPVDIRELLETLPEELDPATVYERLKAIGVDEGPGFAGLGTLHTGEAGAALVAEVKVPASVRAGTGSFVIHPVLLDACLQSLAAHPSCVDAGRGGLILPSGIQTVRVHGDARRGRYCLARIRRADTTSVIGDLSLLDEAGNVLFEVEGARFAVSARHHGSRTFHGERLLDITWTERPCADAADTAPGRWLILRESTAADDSCDDLVAALRAAGADCGTMTVSADACEDGFRTSLAARLTADGHRGVILLPDRDRPGDDEAGRGEAGIGEAGNDASAGGGPPDPAPAERRVRRLLTTAAVMTDLETSGTPPRLWVFTRDAHPVHGTGGLALGHSPLRAVCRVIGRELPELRSTCVDFGDEPRTADMVRELLADGADDEVAWRAGRRHVAQLDVVGLTDADRRETPADLARDGVTLSIRQPGDLDSLELVSRPRREPGPGEVEIRVAAAGLNFADALNAMGLYKTVDGGRVPLGADCSGVITAVGPGVSRHRPGDRVAAMHEGTFSTFLTLPADRVMPVPAGWGFEQAAAVPAVYLTAWYGLHDLARLQPGERVLIHCATGGVGLAAVAIARMAGAEIHATAGSEHKRRYLREIGIDHVMDSRSTAFAGQVLENTRGEGVDVVLNCLTGAAQKAGLELLRVGGRFIELGKRDIYAEERISLSPFRRNIAFSSVDVGLLGSRKPAVLAGALRRIGRELAAGRLPALPHTVYPLDHAGTALRTLGAGEHIGKLVLTLPREGTMRVPVPPADVPVVRGDGAYIVTGGLGGLGLVLTRRLAEAGAGLLVLNGRSAPTPEAEAVLDALRAEGARITVVLGDVADEDTAGRLVREAVSTGLPLRGVLHAAAVVEDAAAVRVDDALLERVWRPKVLGALRLHEATLGHDLHWWLAFSSVSALLGFAGQAAYAAANSWLDGFTTWRRSRGLPALSIAWGAWADHGRGTVFQSGGHSMILPDEGVDACDLLLRHDRPRCGYLPIRGSRWLDTFPDTFSSTFLERLRDSDRSDAPVADRRFLADLRKAAEEARAAMLEDFLIGHVCAILRCDRSVITPERPLTEIGMDSLLALELRMRVERDLGVRIPTRALWDHGSPTALAALLLDRLDLGEPPAAGMPDETPVPLPGQRTAEPESTVGTPD